ncbi:putative DEAD/DEAH box helicase [Emiliania huxleyi CCMP1516]|uniref:ATP-dependent RNA helicase n=2 Tax=Emiliania huxleyi TaxID=2903 RepID=A0A0D3KHA8_EMIH1|nr:putative DEAD/DEAH box helicase [Emiliania huxleyi CCMP1516]EOD35143.1 putative DEAD/DEAH box helicase [Emiliania huxleyi CCMP1516]|eukprot:XP_005787572.1 putative DEAD/DEAH box helicase [Emiliania huxleyi CCMP1516]
MPAASGPDAVAKSFPFEQLTPVQQATIPAALAGRDVIARARTGSGKTLAFLLPAIQRVAADPDQPGVRAVLVSPTRELATQTGAVCEALLSHMPRVSCRCAVGGTSVHGDVAALRGSLCPGILVGTPGRLNDLLSGGHGAASAFGRVACLVLDEADQLLALGFRRPVEAVVASLRRAAHPAAPPWQTLLFSATLRGDAVTVSPPAALAAELVRTLLALRSDPAAKVIVYAGAARLVSFLAALCRRMGLGGSAPLELHARLPHAERALDYHDVTAVVQLGAPPDRATYIHRVGRTGRAGAAGPGCLRRLRWSKEDAVRHTNAFAAGVLGLATPPPLDAAALQRMGLAGVRGVAAKTTSLSCFSVAGNAPRHKGRCDLG